jgi:DNA-binding Lrp family transcriptional regulator
LPVPESTPSEKPRGKKYRIDAIDRRIIAELGKDARLSIRSLAERVHISRTAAHTRLGRLLDHGVITGFSANVDREALGLGITAIVIVKVEADWPTVSEALAALPFVEKAQALSGDIDILLTVSAPDHDALSETILRRIHSMPGVASTRSYMILEERMGTAPELSTDAWQL